MKSKTGKGTKTYPGNRPPNSGGSQFALCSPRPIKAYGTCDFHLFARLTWIQFSPIPSPC